MIFLLSLLGFLQHRYRVTLVAAGALFLGNALLLSLHTQRVQSVRDVALPLVGELVALAERSEILRDQVELAELHAATRTGSAQERVRVFVLPADAELDQVLGGIETLQDVLREKGLLSSMSPVNVGESFLRSDELRVHPLSLDMEVSEDGLRDTLAFLTFAGSLSVFDALTEEEVQELFKEAEVENPTAVIAIETFLAQDLLNYAQEPEALEQHLERSFMSPLFLESFQNILRSSRLFDARLSLGGSLGKELQERTLWPLRFLAIDTLRLHALENGMYRLSLNLFAFSRT